MSEPPRSLSLLVQRGAQEPPGFRADPRFGKATEGAGQAATVEPEGCEEDEPDPIAIAYAQGFAAGAGEAQARAREQALVLEQSREKLTLSFDRLDKALVEELRLRLRDTIAALCEAALAPLALDEAVLARRIEKSVAMLARADDERVIRLHPEDLALVAPRLSEQWQVMPDPALERGALRIETRTGGVEDGPAQWREAIAEALQQC